MKKKKTRIPSSERKSQLLVEACGIAHGWLWKDEEPPSKVTPALIHHHYAKGLHSFFSSSSSFKTLFEPLVQRDPRFPPLRHFQMLCSLIIRLCCLYTCMRVFEYRGRNKPTVSRVWNQRACHSLLCCYRLLLGCQWLLSHPSNQTIRRLCRFASLVVSSWPKLNRGFDSIMMLNQCLGPLNRLRSQLEFARRVHGRVAALTIINHQIMIGFCSSFNGFSKVSRIQVFPDYPMKLMTIRHHSLNSVICDRPRNAFSLNYKTIYDFD